MGSQGRETQGAEGHCSSSAPRDDVVSDNTERPVFLCTCLECDLGMQNIGSAKGLPSPKEGLNQTRACHSDSL